MLLFAVLEEKENNTFAATRKVKRTTNITNDSMRSKESKTLIITTMMLRIVSVFVYKITYGLIDDDDNVYYVL